MKMGSHHRVRVLTPALLALSAGAAPALATTFAPGTNPDYVRHVKETLQELNAQRAALDPSRFTAPNGRRLLSFVDQREADPSDRDHEVWWGYVPDGLEIEPSDAIIFHIDQSIPANIQFVTGLLGQQTEPLDPEFLLGLVDNFQSVLFTRLNGLDRPFGFAQDGGQRTWQTIVNDAINRWGQVAGIEFIFVGGDPVADQPNADSGGDWDRSAFGFPTGGTNVPDIRIGMVELDGPSQPDGSGGAILAWTYDSTSPPVPDLIDDNDTPMDPADDVVLLGYCGNILLDREEKWNDVNTPNLFATVIAREIGFALGLFPTCPANPTQPFSLLQAQAIVTNPPSGSQQPLPPLFFQEPQEDDIRAIQFLYGDKLEVNDIYTDALDVVYQPVPGSSVFSFQPHLGIPQEEFPQGPATLSIGASFDNNGVYDIDRFRLNIPENVISGTLRIDIVPVGGTVTQTGFEPGSVLPGESVSLGTCDNVVQTVNTSAVLDLTLQVEAFDPFTNILTTIDVQDLNGLGAGESIEIPVTTGTYFISVTNDVTTVPLPPTGLQLYELSIEVETPIVETGVEAIEYVEDVGIDAFRDEGFFGTEAVIGVVDGQLVGAAHDVFIGRVIENVSWPGADPAVTSAGRHGTIVAGMAAGGPIGGFEGVAPEAQIISSSIATNVFADGTFAIGKNALYFALLGLADPDFADSLGIASPATVVVSAFGGGGSSLNGEDVISQAYDIVSSLTPATFVIAAGNAGQIEGQSFQGCVLQGGGTGGPGSQFLGYRSVVPPGTSYNGIVVGAVGIVDAATSPLEFADTRLVTANFSSRGPIDSNTITGAAGDNQDVRAGVDILAPGTGFLQIPPDFNPDGGVGQDPCTYDGPRPLSLFLAPSFAPGDDPNGPADPGFFGPTQGTSIAAGYVAGGVALLQDVALSQDPPLSIHPSVMKAILLNGAEKLEGWTNSGEGPGRPQDQRDGFERNPALEDDPTAPLIYNVDNVTTTPLDSTQGAGVMNLRRSLENYFTGYAPAQPPQADFDGPTIDPAETNPLVPTMRIPDEPNSGRAGEGETASDEPVPSNGLYGEHNFDPIGADRLMQNAMGRTPDTIIARPFQAGGGGGFRDPDLKTGGGGNAGFTTAGPTVVFFPSDLDGGGGSGGGGGGGGGGGPPTGGGDAGVRPLEIEPIFVDPIGWDHANIDQRVIRAPAGGTSAPGGFIDYVINVPLLAERPDPQNPGGALLDADRLVVTLCWQREFLPGSLSFADPAAPEIGNISVLELENLNLELYPCDSVGDIPQNAVPVRASNSRFNTVEHIFTNIPASSLYLIRVRWSGTDYDFRLNRPAAEQQYGIAWRVDFSPRPAESRPTGMSDLMNVLGRFGERVGTQAYELGADLDANGAIDWKDMTTVLHNWGGQ